MNKDVSGGFVMIIWDKHTSVTDFDLKVYERMTYLERHCLPVKAVATHLCCLPILVRKIMKPVIFALMDRRTRSRTLMHDVPESGYVDLLSEYGISRDMLPREMGGTIELDQSEWIANRRALEMEEL